jgi:GcrA cell cycle regulator
MRSTEIRAAERTAMAVKLQADGISGPAIAERLGITESSVYARLAGARGNSRYSDWTTERLQLLETMWAEGQTAKEIAATFGDISRNAVLGKVHRLKLPARRIAFNGERAKKNPEERKVKAKTTRRLAQARTAFKRSPPVAPAEPEPVKRHVPAPDPLAIPFTETTRDHCRWICSDAGAPVTVCGHQTVNETSWCAHHAGVVFDPRRGRTHRAVLDKSRPSQSTRWAGHL